MSLTRKLILFCMLFVTGTGLAVLHLAASRANEQLRTRYLASCDTRAGQIVDVLGADLAKEPNVAPGQPAPGHAAPVKATPGQATPGQATPGQATPDRMTQTIRRILRRAAQGRAIYALAFQEERAVITYEARRDREPRPRGTPVALPNAGHRAHRTHAVHSEWVEAGGVPFVRTFAPIHDEDRRVIGLLGTESTIPADIVEAATPWSVIGLCLLIGLAGLGILVIGIGRPLERMQAQLIAKKNLQPRSVRTPGDLLREVTHVIDKAIADRDYFEARYRQQDRQQQSDIRRKDEVISNTVHELRTPLTSIIASLEIITDNADAMTNEEQHEFIEQASTAARHMMFVVNDMLDAAAIEAGHINMNIEPCNLGKMLRDAQRSMEIIATARAMTLVVADVDPSIEVLADPARLMQVLFNLVSNAVKYTPSGTTITMRAWPSLKSVIIEVEDQGHSIPVEMRDKLFTKFSRFDQDEPRVDSSGIGLYLSKKLVELMHGSIGYRAVETGDGSVFWFTLPLATHGSRVVRTLESGSGIQ